MPAKVLILGAGVGGLIVASRLARKFRASEAQITVVDPAERHVYQPGLLYIPFNDKDPLGITRPIRRVLDKRVELIPDRVESIDLAARSVTVAGESIGYDWLVLATGAQLEPERVPGFEAVHHFYDLEHAVQLRQVLKEFDGGRLLVGPSRRTYKCPTAPIEMVLYMEQCLHRRGIRDRTELTYFSPYPAVFGGDRFVEIARPIIEERGIHSAQNFSLKEVKDSTLHPQEGERLEFDLAVVVPPHGAGRTIRETGLAPDGWVDVEPGLLQVFGQENMYALGDVAEIDCPMTGVAAHAQAKSVVDGVLAGVRGNGRVRKYKGQVMCFIETGHGQATIMSFDYENVGKLSQPRRWYHWAKSLLNRLYWIAIPSGRI